MVVVRETAFSTRWYWFTFIVSLVSLVILLLYYSSNLVFYIIIFYWAAEILAVGLGIWSASGLLTRYRVFQRAAANATRKRGAAGVDEEDEEVVYRENIVVRLFKLVGRLITLLFLFVWNTLMRIVYIIEQTILWALILAYDLIYYITYFAWSTVFHVVRLALRIVRFALKVAWKILRILTRLPLARTLWDKKMMPSIMGKWNGRMAERKERRATRLDQRRRLVAAKGLDPDKWQKDQELRHHFPLPHPHDARKGLRQRILERQKLDYNRRDRWYAYRHGKPMPPKMHSERRKRKQEEKDARKKDVKDEKGAKRGGKREDKGEAEKKAADDEIKKNEKTEKKPASRAAGTGAKRPAAADE